MAVSYTHLDVYKRQPYTLRFDSPRGFAYGNQYLHPSTGYSVSRQDCHFSVSTSCLLYTSKMNRKRSSRRNSDINLIPMNFDTTYPKICTIVTATL